MLSFVGRPVSLFWISTGDRRAEKSTLRIPTNSFGTLKPSQPIVASASRSQNGKGSNNYSQCRSARTASLNWSVWVPRRSIISCCSCVWICRRRRRRQSVVLGLRQGYDGAKRLWRFEISAEHRHLICPTEGKSKQPRPALLSSSPSANSCRIPCSHPSMRVCTKNFSPVGRYLLFTKLETLSRYSDAITAH